MQNKYIIGIDFGTTNAKAVTFTDGGEVLGSSGSSYPVYSGEDGRHELDPDQLLEAFFTVLGGVRRISRQQVGLAGISFSCAMHSLIAVDAEGRPLTRAMTWADRRSEPFATALKAGEAGRRIYRQTGTPIHPMSPLSKLLWLREKEPVIFRRAARFISIKEYIWWNLFGVYEVDHSIASATGLLDIHTLKWFQESLDLAGIGVERLSVPVPCTHMLSAIAPALRDRLELPEGLPFIIGASDGCLANLGSGAILPGEAALTIGTSGAIRMTTEQPPYDPKERLFNYILSDGLFVAGGATNNGGNALQWFMEQFSGGVTHKEEVVDDREKLMKEADTVAPGSNGLVFLPYLLGERAPIWNADAKGVWFGIRSIHERRHFMRSVLEGISFSLYQIGTSLEETVGPMQHIYASGGFTHSALWLQMVADIFNKKVLVAGVTDASAIGASIMGFHALGILPLLSAAQLIRVKDTYDPDEERHRAYQDNFKVFSVLYSRLKDMM
jgi:gluconokinase